MTDVYRKWGRAVRYESGTLVRVDEAGESSERDGVFECAPLGTAAADLPGVPREEEVAAAAREISRVAAGVRIERLILVDGVARHEIGGRTWTDATRRMHVALVRPPWRATIDADTFDAEAVGTAAAALARAGAERPRPQRLRITAHVAAALLPSLIGELAMEQCGGGFDGLGLPIETRAVTAGEPPNWYRPTYTARPARKWLNLRALPFGRIDAAAPAAVARLDRGRLLVIDGGDVYPTLVDAYEIEAVSGGEMML